MALLKSGIRSLWQTRSNHHLTHGNMTIFIAPGIRLKLWLFVHEIDTKKLPSTPPQSGAFLSPKYAAFLSSWNAWFWTTKLRSSWYRSSSCINIWPHLFRALFKTAFLSSENAPFWSGSRGSQRRGVEHSFWGAHFDQKFIIPHCAKYEQNVLDTPLSDDDQITSSSRLVYATFQKEIWKKTSDD